MMKNIVRVGLLISCFSAWSQVGIGTHKPHKSAVLEVSSDTKGILLPKHVFEVFDDNQNPIVDPQVGTLVYNVMGGNHEDNIARKGIYVWDGKKWNQLLNNEGVDRMTTIRMMGGTAEATQEVLIPYTNLSATNYIRFKKEKTDYSTTDIERGVTLHYEYDNYGEVFTMPKGYYKVEVSIDGWNDRGNMSEDSNPDFHNPFIKDPNGNRHGYLGLYSKKCGITDVNGSELVPPQSATIISKHTRGGSIQGYTYMFFIRITDLEKKVKFRFTVSNDSSFKEGFKVNQNGVSIKFRRYFD
ncbi:MULTISPECIES: hypothetical protein [unclassified Myroides]|uniref:hypothetical protein n=1 Tax=unclassified Myroides TaxID=2642485 RepID=UPI003100FEAE